MRQANWAMASVVLGAVVVGSACASNGSSQFGGGPGDGGHDGTAVQGDAGHLLRMPDAGQGLGHDSGPGAPHGCDVSCMAAGGTCANNACTLKENTGALTASQEAMLTSGGSADASFKWLYPYDGTVFPRGLIPPTLQFAGTAPDALLVRITYSSMSYTGYFGASSPGRVQLSNPTWTAIMQNAAATDDVVVSVTKISSGQVSGPITESWSVAQGNVRGQIYYETYGSQILGGIGSVGIMTIAPGATAPTPVASGCGNVCHTASADGSTLVSATGLDFLSSISYDLRVNPVATIYTDSAQAFTYGGLYPDGTFLMSATDYRTWLPFGASADSHLYDTKTGTQIAAPGWDGKFTRGGMTAFSPDGQHFVFNRNDLDNGAGHTLAIADFAVATKTFSNAVNLTTDIQHTLAWPAFTPDDASVVFHSATGGAADGGAGSGYETDNGATGNLYRIDVATKTAARLDSLDGYGAGGTSTLPDNDPDLNFAPTVLPEAVGGYYWVVFTTHRSYGNTLPSQDNSDQNGKLWVAALDENPTPGHDSSHPAFYLDGQESGADNLRGFWVLPPCKQDGNTCSSGDECCTGFCRPDGEGGAYSCVPAPAGACSNIYEKCMTSAQCCNASAGVECINDFCAAPPPK